MKDYSCAQIKKRYKTVIQQLPKEGSKVREVFDLFHAYKGQILDLGNSDIAKKTYQRIKHLQLFYGMDVVYLGKGKWCFRGEYIGSKYVLYANDKPLKIKLKASAAGQ